MNKARFENQIFYAVKRISTKSSDPALNSVGTGFVLAVPTNDSEKSYLLLVTNRHVIGNNCSSVEITFNKRVSTGDLSNDSFLNVEMHNLSSSLVVPDEPLLDLAVLNISPAFNEHEISTKHINQALFADLNDEAIVPGSEVWFVGYPAGMFDSVHNLPLMRRGFVASIPQLDFNGKPQFVIDAQVFPGSSGSPVFIVHNGMYMLAGIVAETMVRNNLLQPIQVNHTHTVAEVLGLGIVVKVSALQSFLNDKAIPYFNSQLELRGSESKS